MALELANLNHLLKTIYLPGLTAQLNAELPYFYKEMEKKQVNALGADQKFLVTVGRNAGQGNMLEGGDLPKSGAPKRLQIAVAPKDWAARIELSEKLIKTSMGNGAFREALDLRMEEILRDAKDNLSRQLFGDGKGILGTVKGAIAGTTTGTLNTGHKVQIGLRVDILDKAAPTTVKGTAIVTDVDGDGNIIFDTAVTAADGDFVTISGSYGLEITGLDAIMTPNNTLYGVDRNTNKWFNAGEKSLTGETLDDNFMEFAIQEVERNSGKAPNMIVSGYEAYRALKNYLSQFQRYVEVATRYDAGHKTLHYDGISVERDRYQNDKTMDFLSTDYFTLHTIGELFSFMDMDGNVLSRVPNKAGYEATLLSWSELVCKFPKANYRLKDITVA